ncbi:MAG: hypothetical protein EOO38_05975 [Cytophagaceae bacterium]|nr:MAG: hypothetical protein EOO38_05975 [Cytophagaceae bacterium]
MPDAKLITPRWKPEDEADDPTRVEQRLVELEAKVAALGKVSLSHIGQLNDLHKEARSAPPESELASLLELDAKLEALKNVSRDHSDQLFRLRNEELGSYQRLAQAIEKLEKSQEKMRHAAQEMASK